MFTPDNHHHVVSIGGASFVPPMMTHFTSLHGSLSPSSESSSASSPTHSRFSTSSSASESLEEWDAVQAHLAYARRMADHTATMWQKERLAIEKAKLDGTYTGNVTSRQNGNARPTETKAAASPSSAGSTASEKKAKRWTGLLAALFSPSEAEVQQRGRSRRRAQS